MRTPDHKHWHWNFPKCILRSHSVSGRMSIGQRRQNWSILSTSPLAPCSQSQKLTKRMNPVYLQWYVEEAQFFSFAASDTESLKSVQATMKSQNYQSIQGWNVLPLVRNLVSVTGHGSFNRLMTQNSQLKIPRMAQNKTWDYPEVAFCVL